MPFRKIDSPLEHIGLHCAGRVFVIAQDNPQPFAGAELVVETPALEGVGLARGGARKACQFISQRSNISWRLVKRIVMSKHGLEMVTGLVWASHTHSYQTRTPVRG